MDKMKYCRILDGLEDSPRRVATEWRWYSYLEIDESDARFSLFLGADRSRIIRSWIHTHDCSQCAAHQATDLQMADIREALAVVHHSATGGPDLDLMTAKHVAHEQVVGATSRFSAGGERWSPRRRGGVRRRCPPGGRCARAVARRNLWLHVPCADKDCVRWRPTGPLEMQLAAMADHSITGLLEPRNQVGSVCPVRH
jgi:hypothetical protein